MGIQGLAAAIVSAYGRYDPEDPRAVDAIRKANAAALGSGKQPKREEETEGGSENE